MWSVCLFGECVESEGVCVECVFVECEGVWRVCVESVRVFGECVFKGIYRRFNWGRGRPS